MNHVCVCRCPSVPILDLQRKTNNNASQNNQKIEEEEAEWMFSFHLVLSWFQIKTKQNYRPITLGITDIDIFNKIFLNNSRTHQTDPSPWTNWVHSGDIQMVQYTQASTCFTSHKGTQAQPPQNYLSRCSKGLWESPICIHNKIPEETRNIRELSQYNKCYLWWTRNQQYTKCGKLVALPLKSGEKQCCSLSPFN